MRREGSRTNTASNALSPQHLGNPSAFLGFATRKSGCHHPSYPRNPAPHEQRGNHALQQQLTVSRSNSPTFTSKTTAAFGWGWRGSFPSYSSEKCPQSTQTGKTSEPLCWQRK